MQKPILVVMAAGIGSRFGGLKQMTPFGRNGEGLIDYSIYDAKQAGFERVIFIINHRIENDFRDFIGHKAEEVMDVQYVFQELDKLPEGLKVPTERIKPWGTAHAVLCCKPYIDAPFCTINGDDFYGRSAYQTIYQYLASSPKPSQYSMVGFELGKTLSESGHVSRGVCSINDDGMLNHVIERLHIINSVDGPLYTEDNHTYHRLSYDDIVSMNMWGFTPDYIDRLDEGFAAFYREAMTTNPLKHEYLLPTVVGSLLKEGKCSVKVLRSSDRWFGVTNPSDTPIVKENLAQLSDSGVYPNNLWA
ncbi:MAG TPA: NTP transferase domain-containing protein [Clostridiales bacterium]|jgi:hypothetical protein|nr:NTP transferase domain-containing protein [Clostridiales bacterium]